MTFRSVEEDTCGGGFFRWRKIRKRTSQSEDGVECTVKHDAVRTRVRSTPYPNAVVLFGVIEVAVRLSQGLIGGFECFSIENG